MILRQGLVGGNRKPQTFKSCGICGILFGPIRHLSRRFCSVECKVAAQATGIKVTRRTLRKARSAQSLLQYHVNRGNIIRPVVCERCGNNNCKIEASHRDYGKPLEVDWLCISCHRKEDCARPRGATVIVERWQNATGGKAKRRRSK